MNCKMIVIINGNLGFTRAWVLDTDDSHVFDLQLKYIKDFYNLCNKKFKVFIMNIDEQFVDVITTAFVDLNNVNVPDALRYCKHDYYSQLSEYIDVFKDYNNEIGLYKDFSNDNSIKDEQDVIDYICDMINRV